MIDSFRRLASGRISKFLLALLILSFGVWGIADIFRGFTPDTVARVGNTEVRLDDFQRIYSVQMDNVRQQLGGAVTPEMAELLGVHNQVLGRLVAEAALDNQAGKFGLGMSDETLAARIRNDANWNRGRGFDQSYMDNVLSQNGLTRTQYENQRRRQELRAQIAEGAIGGVETPAAMRRALFEHRSEQRNLQYVVLDAGHAGDIPEPTAEELQAYYQDHRTGYRAPEYRAVNLLILSPAGLAKPEDVTDEEVAAAYEVRKATFYTTPAQAHVYQIVFPTAGEAETARASLSADKTFDQLTTSTGLKPTDLGVVTRDRIVADPAIADAAFALGEGEVSPVVTGRFGFVLIRATDVVVETVKPLDEVRDALRTEMAQREAATQILALRDQVEDGLAGGETIQEVATRMNLTFRAVDAIDEDGLDAAGVPVADLPDSGDLLGKIFDTDVGLANAPIEYDAGAFVWYDIVAITPPRDKTFDEVKEAVTTAWHDDAVDKKLATDATALADRLKAGQTMEAIATERGLEVHTADAVTRASEPTETLSTTAIDAAFGGPDGLVGVAPGVGPATQIVFKVAGVTTPPYLLGTEDTTADARQLDQDVSNDILNEYVTALQSALGVSINDAAVKLAISSVR